MTKKEMKNEIQHACISNYGFAPATNKITLLEASDDGKYILFRVGAYEYSWENYELRKTAEFCRRLSTMQEERVAL